jgi:hypothetical protein
VICQKRAIHRDISYWLSDIYAPRMTAIRPPDI